MISLQIYQVLTREYLSLEMPRRGVLVYRGLGTGKTASAVFNIVRVYLPN